LDSIIISILQNASKINKPCMDKFTNSFPAYALWYFLCYTNLHKLNTRALFVLGNLWATKWATQHQSTLGECYYELKQIHIYIVIFFGALARLDIVLCVGLELETRQSLLSGRDERY
jgi:hypothetical protein